VDELSCIWGSEDIADSRGDRAAEANTGEPNALRADGVMTDDDEDAAVGLRMTGMARSRL
jgi:hypothetical protein